MANHSGAESAWIAAACLIVICICFIVYKCRRDPLIRKDYDMVKNYDSEFFSTDADIEEMSEINIDEDIEEI